MKAVIIFACLIAAASALAIPSRDSAVEIVALASEVGPESYSYNVDTSDGSHHDESGHLENAGTEQEAIVAKGSYSFTDNGQTYTVTYVADENGFHPQGAHLPVGPAA
ncbi:larval cuticle protein 65Ag1-like [Eurosta solidaginis]|uniref:larval cuticle protein 65Ag1-like n=1 Tax=Eurosta solidaginis TaxID=178769 RepID=UPI003530ADA5